MIAKNQPESAADRGIARQPRSRSRTIFLWVFSIIMTLVAGSAFIFKLIEFMLTFSTDESIRFAIMPLLTYLIVASGFACLFVWAVLTGQFRDVEAAKYRMLEMQMEIDREEAGLPPQVAKA